MTAGAETLPPITSSIAPFDFMVTEAPPVTSPPSVTLPPVLLASKLTIFAPNGAIVFILVPPDPVTDSAVKTLPENPTVTVAPELSVTVAEPAGAFKLKLVADVFPMNTSPPEELAVSDVTFKPLVELVLTPAAPFNVSDVNV